MFVVSLFPRNPCYDIDLEGLLAASVSLASFLIMFPRNSSCLFLSTSTFSFLFFIFLKDFLFSIETHLTVSRVLSLFSRDGKRDAAEEICSLLRRPITDRAGSFPS